MQQEEQQQPSDPAQHPWRSAAGRQSSRRRARPEATLAHDARRALLAAKYQSASLLMTR